MKTVLVGGALIFGMTALPVLSAPVLQPADPQPGDLTEGLIVVYAESPGKIRNLDAAREALDSMGAKGTPLRGLDYRDTDDGDPVMTAAQAHNVAADISGYIRFDEPGTYVFEVYSNDGVETKIGDEVVGWSDAVQGCEGNGEFTAEVPSAGWYSFSTLYFQKGGSSCLMMKWGKEGDEKLEWVPNDVFGFK